MDLGYDLNGRAKVASPLQWLTLANDRILNANRSDAAEPFVQRARPICMLNCSLDGTVTTCLTAHCAPRWERAHDDRVG